MNTNMDNVTSDKLSEMYSKASTKKLMQMCCESERFENDAKKLSEKSSSIDKNLVETVKAKFSNVENRDFMSEECDLQVLRMDKQWRLVSASMVKVKRSVQLDGFRDSGMDLYANSRYGVKEHKRYSGWSPFNYVPRIIENATRPAHFTIEPNILNINHLHGETTRLRFSVLDNIPQLDQEKVDQLKRITQEIVWMIDSWRNFYNVLDVNNINNIKNIRNMSSYISNRGGFMNTLNKLDYLVEFNKTLQAKLQGQVAKWEPTIEKWQEANKNFLVLNELSKTELKV